MVLCYGSPSKLMDSTPNSRRSAKSIHPSGHVITSGINVWLNKSPVGLQEIFAGLLGKKSSFLLFLSCCQNSLPVGCGEECFSPGNCWQPPWNSKGRTALTLMSGSGKQSRDIEKKELLPDQTWVPHPPAVKPIYWHWAVVKENAVFIAGHQKRSPGS